MTPRVVIGSNWRPARFETRTATSYSALMPQPSRDAEMLQAALLRERPTLRDRLVAVTVGRFTR